MPLVYLGRIRPFSPSRRMVATSTTVVHFACGWIVVRNTKVLSRISTASGAESHVSRMKRVALVSEHQAVDPPLFEELPLLLELVFHLEEIGEVGIGLDRHLDRERNLVVVENADLFLEAITNRASFAPPRGASPRRRCPW